jgi:hypothetical protein
MFEADHDYIDRHRFYNQDDNAGYQNHNQGSQQYSRDEILSTAQPPRQV